MLLRRRDAGVWPVLSRTSVFLTWWNHIMPKIRRRQQLSKTSSFFSSVCVVAQVSEPSWDDNSIVNAQFGLKADFALPHLAELAKCS